jgi:hypothetical protein
MIPLLPIPKPIQLTQEYAAELTLQFKQTGKSVWRQPWLKAALLSISRNKCAYCEQILELGDSYMEVEHFHDKAKYPERVMDWENLLPSCKRCNGAKLAHDVLKEPILNPRIHIPKEHLCFGEGRLKGQTDLGKQTISVVRLNDISRVSIPRSRTAQEVVNKLKELESDRLSGDGFPVNIHKRIQRSIREILGSAQPDQNYSAIVASALFGAEEYAPLCAFLKEQGLWTADHERLEEQASAIALPPF